MQRARPQFLSFSRRSNRGFTLVEAVITMVIVGILAAVGIPAMTNFINDTRASNATNEFLSAVNMARSEAIKRNRLVTICRSVGAESAAAVCSTVADGGRLGDDWGVGWLVYVENSSSANVGTYEAGEEVIVRHGALPANAFATNSNLRRITFNGTGEPTGGMAGFRINFNFDGNYTRQVCMARTGRVRVIRDALDCP